MNCAAVLTIGVLLAVLAGCGHPAAQRLQAADQALQARYTYLIGQPVAELQESSGQRGITPNSINPRKSDETVLQFRKVSVPKTDTLDPSTCALTVGIDAVGQIAWVSVQGADLRYLDFEDRVADLAVCSTVIDKIVPRR